MDRKIVSGKLGSLVDSGLEFAVGTLMLTVEH